MTEVMHPRNVSCLEGTAQRVGEDGADAEPRSPGRGAGSCCHPWSARPASRVPDHTSYYTTPAPPKQNVRGVRRRLHTYTPAIPLPTLPLKIHLESYWENSFSVRDWKHRKRSLGPAEVP